jgi:orotidine-5'-phosphate decarboxylase
MTPAEAIGKGADYLVIGRPITGAPSPQEAFLKVLAELEES